MKSQKAITDAPNYRAKDARNCAGCQFYQWIEGSGNGTCQKFEFETDCEYLCDAWEALPAPEPMPVQIMDAEMAAVKFLADSDTRIRGYEVLWGDAEHPDLSAHRDYFTKATDFWSARFPNPRPLAFHHGQDAATKEVPLVGTILESGTDEVGRWYIAQLDKAHKYYDAIKKLILQGALKTSSDSIPQYVQRARQPNGTHWIKRWPLPLSSLTPTPAEPRMWEVSQLKFAYKSLGLAEWTLEVDAEAPATADGATTVTTVSPAQPNSDSREAKQMEEKDVIALLEKRESEAKAAQEAKAATDAEIERRVQERLAEAAKSTRPALFAQSTKAQANVYSKYDGMKLEDLAFLATLRAEKKSADEELLKALATRSMKAIEEGKLEAKAMEDFAVKANEVMQSNLASYGDEWVPTNYSSQLWLAVRGKSRLYGSGFIPEIEVPKGYESDTLPIESTDITFYTVSQATAETSGIPDTTVTSSKEGTSNVTLTLGKIGARTVVSGELDEDSIIPAIPEVRAKMERQLGPEIDFVLFNADQTAATGNINNNGTPSTSADYYYHAKGLIVLPFTTNTANKTDASAAITSTKIRAFYNLLGTNGVYVWDDPSQCRVFCDYVAWSKLMGMSDLLTVANAGEYATIVQGADPNRGLAVHNVLWLPSAGVKAAQATGVRHGTESSNTLGRAVLVRGDQWRIGWKRRATFETTRYPRADVTEIVVTMRLGITYFDTDASALMYDI